MGLESANQLRAFCFELSSDRPSPGGGTASAAAGAMAASLLIMVCGITSRSKKHESSRSQLEHLKQALETEREGLIKLAEEDAIAYDAVIAAIREEKRGMRGGSVDLQAALMHAAEVPLETSAACQRILEHTAIVADIGIRSASSDVGVAVLLAEAGLGGAAKNVRINLREILDKAYADHIEEVLSLRETKTRILVENALSKLDKP